MTTHVAIEEVCTVNPTFPRDARGDLDGFVSFLPMSSVSEKGFITEQTERPLREVIKGYTYFEKNDIIVAKITPCMENGKAAYLDNLKHQFGFGSTEFHVLRPGPNVDGLYLFYMIWNPTFRRIAEKNMTGTAGQKRVPVTFLKDYKIPLPNLELQQRISSTLRKADDLRRVHQKAAEVSENLLYNLVIRASQGQLLIEEKVCLEALQR